MLRSRSIAEAISSPDTPPALRSRLTRVVEIREFASAELALPDNGSYRAYADLGRPYVVWNVFAAPEFSVEPLQSCFIFAGCVTYRGFYDEAEARRHAEDLRRQGYDVHVGGVPAYSTLGWFDDPVLSSFVNYPEPEVARMIFHELAHQVTYVKDDSTFNESFAVAVEQEGVRRWLERHGTEQQIDAWRSLRERREQFVALLKRYQSRLRSFYAEQLPLDARRAGKKALFDEMQSDYQALKTSWGGFAGYDRFFARGPNNALLASVSTYTERVPAFTAMLAARGGDMARFYQDARRLARLGSGERMAALDALVPRASLNASADIR
jgi:predicted aminopeptidase